MGDAKRDANSVTTLLGVSSVDGITPVTIWVDPVTHRVLVDLASGGDVVGPGSATDNAIARYDTTTGKLIQDSGVAIDDSGNVYIPTTFGIRFGTIASSKEALRDQTTYLRIGQDYTLANMKPPLGFGTVTSPTAYVHFPAGTASAGSQPIKFTAGTNLTAAEAGVMEWDGTNLYITQTTGPTRKTLAYTSDVLPLAGGTMTGKIVSSGSSEVGKTYTPATGAQTVALDCALNNIHHVTGHADGTAITFTIANATNSQVFIVSILQGAVVSTISAWFATIRWAGGSAPTLTATINKRDTFGFIRTGADTYDGFIIGQNA